jgi:hypothetical protein
VRQTGNDFAGRSAIERPAVNLTEERHLEATCAEKNKSSEGMSKIDMEGCPLQREAVNRMSPGLEDIDAPDDTEWAPQDLVELAKVSVVVVDDGDVVVVNFVATTVELTMNRCHDHALDVTVLVSFADAVD